MFTKPQYGWVNIEIEEFSERASYLTDIPNDCLDAFIFAREKGVPAVMYFDAEGYDYHLIASYFGTYIIIEKDEIKTYHFDKTFADLAKELINDIEQNIDEWANWQSDNQYNSRELKRNKRILEQKVGRLKQLLAVSD